MKKELTPKEKVAIECLFNSNSQFISPGFIGGEIYKQLSVGSGHSSTGSPICKKLVDKGLAERNEKGYYKITSAGIDVYGN